MTFKGHSRALAMVPPIVGEYTILYQLSVITMYMYNLAKVAPFLRCYHYIIIISPTLSASNTRRMAIANGTCVSFCNQPKAHFGLHWVASGTIAVNVTWMKKRIQCLSKYRSMYPSIFNRFPVIQPVSSKVRHFSTFQHILASPGYAHGTIAVNVT